MDDEMPRPVSHLVGEERARALVPSCLAVVPGNSAEDPVRGPAMAMTFGLHLDWVRYGLGLSSTETFSGRKRWKERTKLTLLSNRGHTLSLRLLQMFCRSFWIGFSLSLVADNAPRAFVFGSLNSVCVCGRRTETHRRGSKVRQGPRRAGISRHG